MALKRAADNRAVSIVSTSGRAYPSSEAQTAEAQAVTIVDQNGFVPAMIGGTGLSTTTSVPSSTTSVTLLGANNSRKASTVFNDSTAILYIILGATTASATNYTTQLAPSGYYEVPFGWTGDIRGVWATANGNARITEFS